MININKERNTLLFYCKEIKLVEVKPSVDLVFVYMRLRPVTF